MNKLERMLELTRRDARERTNLSVAHHKSMLADWAALNGLKQVREFPLSRLLDGAAKVTTPLGGATWPWRDHEAHFSRNGIPRAVVSQPYDNASRQSELVALVQQSGLRIHTPPNPHASLWAPGTANFVVFGDVQWLPDQLTFAGARA